MSIQDELQRTIADMVDNARGILAADESLPTIAKRFQAIDLESTQENRRAYRSLLLSTPGLGEFVSGVILFEESLEQENDEGLTLPRVAEEQGMVAGIKVDKGTIPLVNASGDKVTQGLDNLAQRLEAYKKLGARFAKWREVYPVGLNIPTQVGIETNAEILARYAAICQSIGIVPIVEPEVLLDGDHSMVRCFEVTEAVQRAVFQSLYRHGVLTEYVVLKPSMVLPGKENPAKSTPEEIAKHTLNVLRHTVPASVPSINFLSGGQTPEQATANLNAINMICDRAPWELSFSYARALQQPVLEAWRGKNENIQAAQEALLKRAKLNRSARNGLYTPDMEAS